MKCQIYVISALALYCAAFTTAAKNGPTSSVKLTSVLPRGHSCLSLQYEDDVDIENLLGRWYALSIICTSWNRVPMCDRVEFHRNNSMLHHVWTSLDLLDKEYATPSDVNYTTTLEILGPGIWRDTKAERNHPIYLVLSSWHERFLVIALCYQEKYGISSHTQDVFVLGRKTTYWQRDFDMIIESLEELGVDTVLEKTLLWSMCRQYLRKYN